MFYSCIRVPIPSTDGLINLTFTVLYLLDSAAAHSYCRQLSRNRHQNLENKQNIRLRIHRGGAGFLFERVGQLYARKKSGRYITSSQGRPQFSVGRSVDRVGRLWPTRPKPKTATVRTAQYCN